MSQQNQNQFNGNSNLEDNIIHTIPIVEEPSPNFAKRNQAGNNTQIGSAMNNNTGMPNDNNNTTTSPTTTNNNNNTNNNNSNTGFANGRNFNAAQVPLNNMEMPTPNFLESLSPFLPPESPLLGNSELGNLTENDPLLNGVNMGSVGSNTDPFMAQTLSKDMEDNDIDEIINPSMARDIYPNNNLNNNLNNNNSSNNNSNINSNNNTFSNDLVHSPRTGFSRPATPQFSNTDGKNMQELLKPDSYLAQPINENVKRESVYEERSLLSNINNVNGTMENNSRNNELALISSPLLSERLLPFRNDLRTNLLKSKAAQSNSAQFQDSRVIPNSNNNMTSKNIRKTQIKHSDDIGTKEKKTRPAFVNKLWSMVNDPETDDLISWSDNGESFTVYNQDRFIHQVLPKYFKHSKITSFIRQLNMYGWRKLQDVRSGALMDSSDDLLQFENENFKKGKPELLEKIVRQKNPSHSQANNNNTNNNNNNNNNDNNIKRIGYEEPENNDDQVEFLLTNVNENGVLSNNASKNQDPNSASNTALSLVPKKNNRVFSLDMNLLINEFETLKYNQMAIAEDLKRISKENDMLWKENAIARQRHEKQEKTLDKIVHLMASYFGPSFKKMIQDDDTVDSGAHASTQTQSRARGHSRNKSNSGIKITTIEDEDNQSEDPFSTVPSSSSSLNTKGQQGPSSRSVSQGNNHQQQQQQQNPQHDENQPSPLQQQPLYENSPMVQSVPSSIDYNSPPYDSLPGQYNHGDSDEFYKNLAMRSRTPKLLENGPYNHKIPLSNNNNHTMHGQTQDFSNSALPKNEAISLLQESINKQEAQIHDLNELLSKISSSNGTTETGHNSLNFQNNPSISQNDLQSNDFLNEQNNEGLANNANLMDIDIPGFDLHDYLAPTPGSSNGVSIGKPETTLPNQGKKNVSVDHDSNVELGSHIANFTPMDNHSQQTSASAANNGSNNPGIGSENSNEARASKRTHGALANSAGNAGNNNTKDSLNNDDDDDDAVEEIINPSQNFKKLKRGSAQ